MQPTDPETEQTRAVVDRLLADHSDEEAFRCLFELFHRRLYRLFARKGFGAEDCQELTQETFLRIYQNIGQFRREARFKTWLFTVATNVYREHLRRTSAAKRSGQEMDLEELPGAESASPRPLPDEVSLGAERRRLLRRAVEALPEQMRKCLVLRMYQGMKYREIAAVLALSIDTVKAHLHQARKRLSRELGEDLEDAQP